MNISEFARSGLASLRTDLGSPVFTWKDKDIPCVPQSAGELNSVTLGGFERQVSITLRVDSREFRSADSSLITIDSELYTSDDDTPRPVSGKRLTFRGKEYKVGRATVSPCQGFISLDLLDRNA